MDYIRQTQKAWTTRNVIAPSKAENLELSFGTASRRQ